ncbi:MAG TPA: hypothetical protein PKY95_02185, partial [candidate division Zixibacteria bacterium]|nr:hypothetical protein [candidate division Zixibacteria bacterium]
LDGSVVFSFDQGGVSSPDGTKAAQGVGGRLALKLAYGSQERKLTFGVRAMQRDGEYLWGAYYNNLAGRRASLALDGEYTFWSRFDGLDFAFSNAVGLAGPADTVPLAREFFTADLSAPVDWDNSVKLMLGASYDFPEFLAPEVGLTLVGGLSWDQSPARNEWRLTPQLLDTGNKFGFSGGGIVHLDRWDLGLVTSYTRLQHQRAWDLDMDEAFTSFPGYYQPQTFETILSFNYRF